MKDVCIIIPTHKEVLTGNDEKSFLQTLNIFKNKDIKLIIPNNISDNFYIKYDIEIIKLSSEWFKSPSAYNAMCCEKEFYELFRDYKYVLICQTDAWVFKDNLDYFIGLDCDYYGAPWPQNHNLIGNGGLSLRKTEKMIEICEKYTYDGRVNEDIWFSINHKTDMKICDIKTACNFSIETPSNSNLNMVDDYPMGVHGKIMFKTWGDGKDFKRKYYGK